MATSSPKPLATLLSYLDAAPSIAEQKFIELRRSLIRLFEWRGCRDPEDQCDETICRVVVRLAEGLVIEHFYAFVRRVAQHVHSESVRREARYVPLDDDSDWPEADPHEEAARIKCFRKCLEQLTPAKRELLERYCLDKDRSALAAELCLTPNGLRVRIHHLRRKVIECVQRCLEPGGAALPPVRAEAPV